MTDALGTPGLPLQVVCYERADDLGFGVSGVVTRGRGLRGAFPEGTVITVGVHEGHLRFDSEQPTPPPPQTETAAATSLTIRRAAALVRANCGATWYASSSEAVVSPSSVTAVDR